MSSSGGNGRYAAWLLAGYPLAWALGLGPVIFAVLGLMMAAWLLKHRPILVAPGTVLYLVFLVMVIGSAVQITSVGRAALYLMRVSWYGAALITFIYLVNQHGPRLRRTMVRAMVALLALTVLGGYGAILTPTLAWRSPLSYLLPGSIAADEFVADLINPRVAEIQVFRWQDVTLYRPAAPFSYTNGWGSAFALLFPFLLAAWADRRIGISRRLLVALMVAGIPPFYTALNRGAWLTLSLGLVYGVVRWAWVRRNPMPIVAMVMAVGLAVPVAMVSGVLDSAEAQLETRTEDSNETRADIYVETFKESLRSPLVGYASPLPNPSNPGGPPLGTHGQLWAIMFAHGLVAVVAYLLFFLRGFLFSTGSGPVAHWAKVSLAIGLAQLPIYGHLPLQLFIMVAAMVMASWPDVLPSETSDVEVRPPVSVAVGG